jgi:hypothetical protein
VATPGEATQRDDEVGELAFERRVERDARRFDLGRLLALLARKGYRREELLFSAGSGSTLGIVESVRFARSPFRVVHVTLNVGLLSNGVLLPAYFFAENEQAPDPDVLVDFLRFFDHRLIANLVAALYPEQHGQVFRDWGEAKRSLFGALGAPSIATVEWLARAYFPELRSVVERRAFASPTEADAARPGASTLAGGDVLGGGHVAEASGFELTLVADEEVDARGRSWAQVVDRRVDRLVEHLPGAPITVRLRVLEHASWARLDAQRPGVGRPDEGGFLGYDRLQGDAAEGHAMVVYPRQGGDAAAGGARVSSS